MAQICWNLMSIISTNVSFRLFGKKFQWNIQYFFFQNHSLTRVQSSGHLVPTHSVNAAVIWFLLTWVVVIMLFQYWFSLIASYWAVSNYPCDPFVHRIFPQISWGHLGGDKTMWKITECYYFSKSPVTLSMLWSSCGIGYHVWPHAGLVGAQVQPHQ